MQSTSTPDYPQAIKEATQLFNELLPVDQWKLESDKNGLKIYTRKDKATGLKMARGQCTINKPISKVVDCIEDAKAVLEWDKTVCEADIVERVGEYRLCRSLAQKQALVTQREIYLACQTIKNADETVVIVGKSVEHPSYPLNKDYVRGHIYLWGWLLTPNKSDESKTDAVYMMFLDPKGMVPTGIFNSFVEQQAMNAQKVKDYTEKNY